MSTSKQQNPEFSRLLSVIKKLRDPITGCPWDLKQTHKTLLKYLLEESYEFVHAVEHEPSEMEEELGDILLQVLLHSQIASESKRFDIESVSKCLCDKMIRRHPHIFSKETQNVERSHLTDKFLQENWDKIKREEAASKSKSQQDQVNNLLPASSFHGPALSVSSKIGKRTNQYNFDWENIDDVALKVEEEWLEVKEELEIHKKNQQNIKRVQEEIGDLLFSVAQLSRHAGLDPEETLRMANQKFLARFNSMNDLILKENKNIKNLKSSELEKFWSLIKDNETY